MTAPPDDETTHEYEIDQITGHRKQGGKEYYYIHWKGYPAEDDTWEPRENLSKAALEAWERRNQGEKGKKKGHGKKN